MQKRSARNTKIRKSLNSLVFNVSMSVFMALGWFFMVLGGFSWFQVGFTWFFMVPGVFFMVFHGHRSVCLGSKLVFSF